MSILQLAAQGVLECIYKCLYNLESRLAFFTLHTFRERLGMWPPPGFLMFPNVTWGVNDSRWGECRKCQDHTDVALASSSQRGAWPWSLVWGKVSGNHLQPEGLHPAAPLVEMSLVSPQCSVVVRTMLWGQPGPPMKGCWWSAWCRVASLRGGVGVSLGLKVLMASLWSWPIVLWAFEFWSGNKEEHFIWGCQQWNGWSHVWSLWREMCRWSVWNRRLWGDVGWVILEKTLWASSHGTSISAESHREWNTFPWRGWSQDGAQVPLLCDSCLSPVTGAVTTWQVSLFDKAANS